MITVFGSIGMDLLFSLPHLPAVGETVLAPAYITRRPWAAKAPTKPWQPHATGSGCVSLAAPERTSFVGVLADRGLEMQPAMRRACVAASMTCKLVGAAPSFPTEFQ